MTASMNPSRVEIAFDVGHSSIGWSVLSTSESAPPSVLGCGSVIFEKDSALANTRRLHRSQRRHVRATRQRIARMENYSFTSAFSLPPNFPPNTMPTAAIQPRGCSRPEYWPAMEHKHSPGLNFGTCFVGMHTIAAMRR